MNPMFTLIIYIFKVKDPYVYLDNTYIKVPYIYNM